MFKKLVMMTALVIMTGCTTHGFMFIDKPQAAPESHTYDPKKSYALNAIETVGMTYGLPNFNDFESKSISQASNTGYRAVTAYQGFTTSLGAAGVLDALLSTGPIVPVNYDIIFLIEKLPKNLAAQASQGKLDESKMKSYRESLNPEFHQSIKRAVQKIAPDYTYTVGEGGYYTSTGIDAENKVTGKRFGFPYLSEMFLRGAKRSLFKCPEQFINNANDSDVCTVYGALFHHQVNEKTDEEFKDGSRYFKTPVGTGLNKVTLMNAIGHELPDNGFVFLAGSKERGAPYIVNNKGVHRFIPPKN